MKTKLFETYNTTNCESEFGNATPLSNTIKSDQCSNKVGGNHPPLCTQTMFFQNPGWLWCVFITLDHPRRRPHSIRDQWGEAERPEQEGEHSIPDQMGDKHQRHCIQDQRQEKDMTEVDTAPDWVKDKVRDKTKTRLLPVNTKNSKNRGTP